MAQKAKIEYSNRRLNELIDDLIHSERNRQILKARYIDGALISELSDRFDLSEKQIKNILKRDGDYVFLHL